MTHGAEPKWGDGPYPQWIKRETKLRGWNRKQFAEELRKASEGGLQKPGAEALARRASHGENISAKNRLLIAKVLGGEPAAADPMRLLEQLAAVVERGEQVARELPGLLAAAQEIRDVG